MKKSIIQRRTELISSPGRWLLKAGGMILTLLPFVLWPALSNAADDTRPNIVLLVADDAGYSDFAGFGGEAQTPAMDSLASSGVKLTNFHAMPNCTPSRSTFLTGADNHINGVGTMQGQLGSAAAEVQRGTPGYKGYANDRTVMISELLKDSGYHTYMVGKWHLGEEGDVDEQTVFKRGTWPIDRGFDESFGILNGGGDHFGACERVEGTCTRFFENAEILQPTIDFGPGQVGPTPTDNIYFSATAHTDKAIEFIDKGLADATERTPFFLYYADTMPHEPNQLPAEYLDSARMQNLITHYREKGWDGVRAERFQKMKSLGLIPAGLAMPPRYAQFPAWDDETDERWAPLMARVTEPPYNVFWTNKNGERITAVSELKDVLAKKMAIYTGMVEFFDSEVNRLIQHLKDKGEYENTLFIYFSDNGGDSNDWDWDDRDSMLHRGTNNAYDNLGRPGSFFANGEQWAQAVNVPFYGAKATVAEGGLRAAFVAAHPGGNMAAGSQSHALTTVMDVAATIIDYAGVTHPVGVGEQADWDNCNGSFNGKENICPMNGKSMRSLMQGTETSVHDREPIGYEIFGRKHGPTGLDRPNKAMFYEEDGVVWKLLRLGDAGWGAGPGGTQEPWKLYNLNTDPSEANDRRETNPVMFKRLLEMYNEYEQNVGVIPQSAQRQNDVEPGTQVTHTLTITNTGNAAETYTPGCRSDWMCVLSNEGGAITLNPGETFDLGVTISVPSDVAGQTRTSQVSMTRTSAPQMSDNQIFVTQVAGELGSGSGSGGGGSLSPKILLLLLMTGLALGLRRRKQG
jgi:arylsulfatase